MGGGGSTVRVFICYSHHDDNIARRLAADLRESGIDTWRDKEDIPRDVAANTTTWRVAVERALRDCTHLAVVLTPDSTDSAEVASEWNYFLRRGKPVLPVLARPCDIPYRLEALQYYDLTRDYKGGLARLVAALGGTHSERPRRAPAIHPWMLVLLVGALILGIGGLVLSGTLGGAVAEEPTLPASAQPDPTVRPTDSPSPAPCMAAAESAVNIRSGPDIAYPVENVLGQGEQAPIIGRNADGSWWRIEGGGWVSTALVTASGNCSAVPVVPDGLVATPSPDSLTATISADPAQAAVAAAVVAFDQGMQYALTTRDTTRLASVAQGQALQDRLDAVDILTAGGNCQWYYTRRNEYPAMVNITRIVFDSESVAEVDAILDRDGTVVCGGVERPEYAFTGPLDASYVLRFSDGQWYVTEFRATNIE